MKKDIKITEQEFNSYDNLISSATNWEHSCTYQLSPSALIGMHKVIEFNDIQISFTSREGGMIHNLRSPLNSISVAIIEVCEAEACFGEIKLKAGDIIFFDDKQSQYFMSKGKIKSVILSINKKLDIELISHLSSLKGYVLKDRAKVLSKLLYENEEKIVDTQNMILLTLQKLIETQEQVKPKLTKGEAIAFKILKDITNHMDGEMQIEPLAVKYGVSKKTLQNSFRALFGFTPKIFSRLLKLNLVHHELKDSEKNQTTVSRIAMKWGFKHMGSFSKYYTELFNENPSQTLKDVLKQEYVIDKSCVSRQEEIE